MFPDLSHFDIPKDQPCYKQFPNHKNGVIKETGQVVHFKFPKNNNDVNKLIQEYNISCKYSHPNLQMPVGFYSSTINQDMCYITIFQKNGSLDQFIQSNSTELTDGNRYCIAFGIAEGIQYLHNNKIMQYKLIPKNILIDDDKYPVIKKYGIPILNTKTDDEVIKYKAYFAPEILKGGQYDEKSDIYSFGLLLYLIFSGLPPYDGLPEDQMMEQKNNSSYSIDNDDVPDFIIDLTDKCTNPDPAKRPLISEVLKELNQNQYQISDGTTISEYLSFINTTKGIKKIFRIPKQILKQPTIDHPWTLSTDDPINYQVLEEIFRSQMNNKIIMIDIFGLQQSGKSTFLKTLTGNQAYFSGKGMFSTTIGILIDGPYTVQNIIDNITDRTYKSAIEKLNFNPNAIIYFIDTQGIGDENYNKKYKVILERIHSIFGAFSSICLTITDCAIQQQSLLDIFKILRRVHFFSKGLYTKLLILGKKYDEFNRLGMHKFNNLNKFHPEFIQAFWNANNEASSYYFKDDLIPIPLGNCQNKYDKYMSSVWYSFYHILKNIDETKLISADIFLEKLKAICIHLFGMSYQNFYNELMESDEKLEKSDVSNEENNPIIKVCRKSCIYLGTYALNILNSISERSRYDEINNAINSIKCQMDLMSKFYLPYFLGEFNIPLDEYEQYSCEIIKDINSYLKTKSLIWKNNLNEEKQLKKKKKEVGTIITFHFIPIANIFYWGYIIKTKLNIDEEIENMMKIREEVKDSFKPTFYPYFWNKSLQKYNEQNHSFSIFNLFPIFKEKRRLIVFYEQNNNDSSLLFRALTNINVNYQKKQNASDLFEKISCKDILTKFKRFGSIKENEFPNESIDIQYLKGTYANQDNINQICQKGETNIIFVTSIKEGQKVTIYPRQNKDEKIKFYVFCLSKNSITCSCENKRIFYKNKIILEENKQHYGVMFGNILPIKTSDFSIPECKPVANSFIKQAVRLIINGKLEVKD